jgi:hypothetical protein
LTQGMGAPEGRHMHGPIERADLALCLYGAGDDSERLERALVDLFVWARLRLGVDTSTLAQVALARADQEIADAEREAWIGGYNPQPRLFDRV